MLGLNDLLVKLAKLNKPLYIAIVEKDVEKLLYLIDSTFHKEVNDNSTINENIDIEKLYKEVLKWKLPAS
jgi:hypothetical protein